MSPFRVWCFALRAAPWHAHHVGFADGAVAEDELAQVLEWAAAPLGRDARDVRALAALLAPELPGDSPEVSLRLAPANPARGGRLMLERAPPRLALALADFVGVPLPGPARALLAHAEERAVPLIVGWDVGRGPLLKLYGNASDLGRESKRALATALGLPVSLPPGEVLGLNVGLDRLETKVYRQAADPARLELPARPAALAALPAVAWVSSHDVTGSGLALRAGFLAPAPGADDAVVEAVRALTGHDLRGVLNELPFATAPARQVGWSRTGDLTVYWKLASAGPAVTALEPRAVFRSPEAEVGLFVEPKDRAVRAFLRSARWALSFRTREGSPARGSLEPLARWAAASLEAAPDAPLDDPPAPWARVEPLDPAG